MPSCGFPDTKIAGKRNGAGSWGPVEAYRVSDTRVVEGIYRPRRWGRGERVGNWVDGGSSSGGGGVDQDDDEEAKGGFNSREKGVK
ncbi:hypothetical protein PV326_005868 [Microctonus aethiopoides]|nr:hypothetical protein PV326_005868 [Microctonus aethiopoides]